MLENNFYFETDINDSVMDAIQAERETVGFYSLCDQPTGAYKEFARNVRQKEVVIIGIGGSALGPSAIYEFLGLTHTFDKRLHIVETTDPLVLKRLFETIDMKEAFYCVISKSGSTVETLAAYKYIASRIEISSDNCVMITDAGSKLEAYAKEHELPVFNIPDNVGGRFSVLSAVGLVPLSAIGVDIDGLLAGAKEVRDSFFGKGEMYTALMKKATWYSNHAEAYDINCLFSYSEAFRQLNAWYVQLWGESLGKIRNDGHHVGLTPVGLTGPTDQHSFLQLIVEGKRDKTVTFIKVRDFGSDAEVPALTLENLEALDILNGYKFAELINMQADSIIQSLRELGDIPVDVIEVECLDAKAIGAMMMYYELLTALTAQMMKINAYDQPGVEMGKKILKEMMSKA